MRSGFDAEEYSLKWFSHKKRRRKKKKDGRRKKKIQKTGRGPHVRRQIFFPATSELNPRVLSGSVFSFSPDIKLTPLTVNSY